MPDVGGSDGSAGLRPVVEAVLRRRPEVLRESLARKPYDLFVMRTGRWCWAGRKVAVPVGDAGPPVKCCLVTAGMIDGLVDDVAVGADGASVVLRPLNDDGERAAVFSAFASSTGHEIRYPFRRLAADGTEPVSPPDYWTPEPDRVREWDAAEAPLRRHALAVLRRHGWGTGVVFDPACSTGAFLGGLRDGLPGLRVVGQDLSAAMVEHARPRLDEAHVGDGIDPVMPPVSVDVLVLRHLTLDVLDSDDARSHFDACLPTVRPGGLVLLTGHTPVLVPPSHAERSGLTVLERSGVTPGAGAAFQFYVLRTPSGPAPRGAW